VTRCRSLARFDGQLRKTYERSLADAYALGVRSSSDATDSLTASASRSVIALLVYLALALLIGVGIAFWVVRAILKPAFVLSRNAIEVLNRGRLLVGVDERGSSYGVAVGAGRGRERTRGTRAPGSAGLAPRQRFPHALIAETTTTTITSSRLGRLRWLRVAAFRAQVRVPWIG
jgi:hypothetical protein